MAYLRSLMSVENLKFTNNTEIVYYFIKITLHQPLKRESIDRMEGELEGHYPPSKYPIRPPKVYSFLVV